ncbi:transcriptional regulator [Nocardia sienata]|uniref:transcriptional regulator n=1 Tax=Nocardia sienata TaxID=248552 RepID=UPI0007A48F93|nr:transcriptional regulator [Nocardia sienata]
MSTTSVEPAFDEIIHPPNRLRLCAALAAAELVEFAVAREVLGISDSVLSKQVKILKEAGYVRVDKKTRNARPQTWIGLTKAGRAALDGHLAELRKIAEQAQSM